MNKKGFLGVLEEGVVISRCRHIDWHGTAAVPSLHGGNEGNETETTIMAPLNDCGDTWKYTSGPLQQFPLLFHGT